MQPSLPVLQPKIYLGVLKQGWRSRGPASVSRPASRPNYNGLGLSLGLDCPCLGLGLGGFGFVYGVSRTDLGLETGLEA